MSEELIKSLSEVLVSGVDQIMGIPVSFGRGTAILPTPVVSNRNVIKDV